MGVDSGTSSVGIDVVEHVQAKNPSKAAEEVFRRFIEITDVIAVFEGHIDCLVGGNINYPATIKVRV